MAIDLTKFVKINISYHNALKVSGSRNVAVLYQIDTTAWPFTGDSVYVTGISSEASGSSTIWKADVEGVADPVTITAWGGLNHLRVFFDNNGYKLHVIKATPTSTTIKALPDEEIIIMANGTDAASTLYGLASNESYLDGIKEKIFIGNIGYSDLSTDLANYNKENFVVKAGPTGIEAAMAAYFTKINVYTTDIKDYAFTVEDVEALSSATTDSISDDILLKANVDAELAMATRNLGGNTSSGKDATNLFVKIVLVQTLTDRLINLLISKIKYDQRGLSKIAGVINDELSKYRANGYLATNKSWADEDLYYRDYLIVSKGELLNLGYKFVILPFSSLSDDDRAEHKLPEIYLILAENYGIRKIVITGEVF